MPCCHPMPARRDAHGRPYMVPRASRAAALAAGGFLVPCGSCIECRLEYSRGWAVRMMHEAQMATTSCFVTLTLDDDHIPEDCSLDVSHFQTFAKALRKRVGPFRYFHCGEYGGRYGRPHYHAALFGVDFREDRVRREDSRSGHPMFDSRTLLDAWKLGSHCPIGDLTFQSAAYVARYVTKKIKGPRANDHLTFEDGKLVWKHGFYKAVNSETGEVHERTPEYATMSRRPGLGRSWFEKYGEEVYRRDEVVVNGRVSKPPAYYDRLLEKADPGRYEEIKAKRQREMRAIDEARLPVIERVTEARIKFWHREVD